MVNIPKNLQPKISGGRQGKAVTVGQAKKIKKYGSLENYDAYQKAVAIAAKNEKEVNEEINELGLDDVKDEADYAAKYSQASELTKKYLLTPTQVKTQIEESRKEIITKNKPLIDERISYYQNKMNEQVAKYKERERKAAKKGDAVGERYYDDKAKLSESYYEGIIKGLKSGYNKASSFVDIKSYAIDLGGYERDKYQAKLDKKNFKYQKPRETKEEWNQRLIDQGRQQGMDYLAKNPEQFPDMVPVKIIPGESTASFNKRLNEAKAASEPKFKVDLGPQTLQNPIVDYSSQSKRNKAFQDVVDSPKNNQPKLNLTPPPKTYDYGQGTKIYTTSIPEPTKPTRQKFEPSTFYLGGKEWSANVQPNFGTVIDSGFSNIGKGQRIVLTEKPITADYSTNIKNRVTEFIPVAGVPLTQFDEQVYLRDSSDAETLSNLIKSKKPGAARDMRIFLRDQQVKLKEDLSRYTELTLKSQTEKGLTDIEYKEADELSAKINKGQRGTFGNIVYTATEKATESGETVNPFGINISPRSARRIVKAGAAGYNIATDVLIYQGASAIVSPIIGATETGAAVIGSLNKVAKVTKYSTVPLGLGLGGAYGFNEYKKSGDLGDAISVGVGASLGLFGAVYSKQIVEGTGKAIKITGEKIYKLGGYKPTINQMNKRGEFGMFSKQESKYILKDGKYVLKNLNKKEVVDILRAPKKSGNIINYNLDKQTKFERLRGLIKSINTDDTNSLRKILNAAKEAYSPELVNDFMAQEGISFIRQADASNLVTGLSYQSASAITTVQPIVPAAKTSVVFNKAAETASAYAGLGLYEKSDTISVSRLDSKNKIIEPQVNLLFNEPLVKDDMQLDTLSPELSFIDTPTQDLINSPIQSPIQKTIQTPIQVQIPEQTTIQKQIPKQTTIQTPIQIQIPGQTTIQKQIPGFTNPRRGGGRDSVISEPIEGIGFRPISIDFGGRKTYSSEDGRAYFGEVKINGKYKKVTDKPHTKAGAFSAIARVIDNTISAQGRVAQYKKQPKKGTKLSQGDDYYDQNRNKFRGFKMYKGKQVPIKNTLIEKKQYRTDMPGETKKLSLSQIMSKGKLGRPSANKKNKTMFRL